MPPTTLYDLLKTWHDFFLLVGGVSATLMGLLFVSLTLVVELPTVPSDRERELFASPILVHFAYAIVIAAICLAPWQQTPVFGAAILVNGLVLLRKSIIVFIELWRQHQGDRSITATTWFHLGVAPIIVGLDCAASGLALIRGDLRGVAGAATGAFSLDVMALFSAWNLFLWMLKEQRRTTESPPPS
jgi:hypothetical protein